MKYKDITVNSVLISPYGGRWKVIKKYGADMWLIKKEKLVCVLMGGQVRKGWHKDG